MCVCIHVFFSKIFFVIFIHFMFFHFFLFFHFFSWEWRKELAAKGKGNKKVRNNKMWQMHIMDEVWLNLLCTMIYHYCRWLHYTYIYMIYNTQIENLAVDMVISLLRESSLLWPLYGEKWTNARYYRWEGGYASYIYVYICMYI